MKREQWTKIIGLLFLFIIIGTLVFIERKNKLCLSAFKFVNPIVACGEPDIISKTSYNETRSLILDLIKKEQELGKVGEVSVYFRDLVHGPIFGINELTGFVPASLLKLPLALVFMNSAETEPELLGYTVTYEGTTSVGGQIFKPQKSAEQNKTYSIEELLKLMLIYSDNASTEVLIEFLAKSPQRLELRKKVFQELGLVDPKDRAEGTISANGYASLFRMLYNAAYLDGKGSEKVLGWLSESDFNQGIKAGVPTSIKIAHKFGERFISDNQQQIHDCGVVYYPGNPYVLCIMSQGDDYQELLGVIQEISKIIYEEVDSRRL